MFGAQHQVQARRLFRDRGEPATPENLAINREGVGIGMVKGHQAQHRISDNLETEPLHAVFHSLPRRTDLPLQPLVPFDAQRVHHAPGRGDRPARPRARQRRRLHRRAAPARHVERHVGVKLLTPEQHGGGALGAIAIFVKVGAHRLNRWHFEIKGWHRHAIHPRERREISAHTSIDMQPDTVLRGRLAQCRNRVDNAVREVRRRTDHHDGGCIHRFTHGNRIGLIRPIRLQRHAADFDVHQMRRLVERQMCRLRQHNILAFARLAQRPGIVAGCLHRHRDRVGPAGCHRPGGSVRPMEQAQPHADDFLFHLREAWKGQRPQTVLRHVEPIGVMLDG